MLSLASPITLRSGATARNRLALAPLTNQQSHRDGTISGDEHAWLERRAAGGFAIVETCAAHVSPDGQGFPGQLGVWGDHQLPGLRALAAAIAGHGALGLVQLYHGGVRCPSALTGQQPWSASAFDEPRPNFERPRPATRADLGRVLADFVAAATRSAAAGFHGVELHAAHGYLFSQFLSSTMNQRSDEWGGSLANRARLLRDVARAVRAACPHPFTVGVRLSPEDFGHARGIDLDETVQVAAWLAEDGLDFVHVSLWDGRKHSLKYPDRHPLPPFRAALPRDVAIIAAGKVWTADDATALLDHGADLVAIGRAAILNPDWPRLALAGPFEPERGPLTPTQLRGLAISDTFVEYLRNFRLVRDE
ncbi:MAG: NADH:flavin oxidoreductase [Nannocystis sp.]|uniref:NADH:flavin oxidoreductase n=1 Tax=Nannocystis sp. TaxID=1962667 RepID=UPI002426FF24|nr:NADH:flavin oxidoreductase [Nannocystis sp.]MBK9754101.1 NADH:flavin oxidoreductase [Nannocystis sp.]